jgi:hypothetical protein
MENTTKFVKNENTPILLDKQSIEFIIDNLSDYRTLLTFEFEDDEQCTEDRLSTAKQIVDCDTMINYLKSKIK